MSKKSQFAMAGRYLPAMVGDFKEEALRVYRSRVINPKVD
jgi:hypothetical protein